MWFEIPAEFSDEGAKFDNANKVHIIWKGVTIQLLLTNFGYAGFQSFKYSCLRCNDIQQKW